MALQRTTVGKNTLPKRMKRVLIGPHLLKARKDHERLTKTKALAVLSSDAVSSVAYATEAGMISLQAAGSGHIGLILPIAAVIVGILLIVVLSYRQAIPVYRNGGGAYTITSDNLGEKPGLVAAASLLVDYVLTVAVSVSAGVLALVSLFPGLSSYTVLIDIVVILIITGINLRGISEAGTIFAVPTYVFIFSTLLLIVVGSIKSFGIDHQPLIGNFTYIQASEPLGLFLILKSFAEGCGSDMRPKKLALHVLGLVSRVNTDAVDIVRHMQNIQAEEKQVFSINIDLEERTSTMLPEWQRKMHWASDVSFEVLEWPVVDMGDCLDNLVSQIHELHPDRQILIVCSQTIYDHWWKQLLHTNFAMLTMWKLLREYPVNFYVVRGEIPTNGAMCEVSFEQAQPK